MNPLLKNILAVVAGIVVGMIINFALVLLGSTIIPLPAGIDPANPESIRAGLDLIEFKHLIFPFLGHALGTLAGAFTAAKLAMSHKMRFALGIGIIFLILGIINLLAVPSPLGFAVADLILAYIPMGWLGGIFAGQRS